MKRVVFSILLAGILVVGLGACHWGQKIIRGANASPKKIIVCAKKEDILAKKAPDSIDVWASLQDAHLKDAIRSGAIVVDCSEKEIHNNSRSLLRKDYRWQRIEEISSLKLVALNYSKMDSGYKEMLRENVVTYQIRPSDLLRITPHGKGSGLSKKDFDHFCKMLELSPSRDDRFIDPLARLGSFRLCQLMEAQAETDEDKELRSVKPNHSRIKYLRRKAAIFGIKEEILNPEKPDKGMKEACKEDIRNYGIRPSDLMGSDYIMSEDIHAFCLELGIKRTNNKFVL